MIDLFKKSSLQAKLCTLGVILCFSGLGSLAIWTNVNIYYFSYFYMHDKSASLQVFNIIISITALIAALIALVSMPLSKAIGYSNLVKICMVIYPLSTIIAAFQTNVWSFIFFYSVIVGMCAGLVMVPMTYCLYSHYGEENTGNVTGI